MPKILLYFFLFGVSIHSTSSQNWSIDIEEAKMAAAKENKNILLVFKGSDWCAPCIKLEKRVFSSEEFISNSNSNFILIEADFPRKKKNMLSKQQQEKNNQLADEYNKNGYFPLVLVLNAKGVVLGTIGYNKLQPLDYLNQLIDFTK